MGVIKPLKKQVNLKKVQTKVVRIQLPKPNHPQGAIDIKYK